MRTLAVLLSIFPFLLAGQSRAQRADIPAAPPEVQATMKRGGISLQYIPLPADSEGKEIWAHLYVVPPKNVAPENVSAGTTFTRAYFIESNTVRTPIPFYLEIFTGSGKTLYRRNSIIFQQQISPVEIHAKWRDPAKKRGLTLMLFFMLGNSGPWHVISLDDRFQTISKQLFPTDFDTAEPDYNIRFSEDKTDSHGILKLGTLISNFDKKSAIWYEWQGTAFVDPVASYFVVAATRKTRKAAEDFAIKQKLQEYEIVATDEHKEYTGLPPHSYLVVVTRFRGDKPVSEYEKQYPKYGVLKAF